MFLFLWQQKFEYRIAMMFHTNHLVGIHTFCASLTLPPACHTLVLLLIVHTKFSDFSNQRHYR